MQLCSNCASLQEEVEKLKQRNEELENLHVELPWDAVYLAIHIYFKQSHLFYCRPNVLAIDKTAECFFFFCQIDIGLGVLVEEPGLVALKECCPGAPAKFARGLLRQLFTKEELRGKSLYGRKSNAHPGCAQREGLDPVKVKAIIGR
ncbi:hypothetical protein HPB48_018177 [Haemaphysalis longicornis]|uniref:BEN domain-containing protein n=1 Tax=Haemaphysalis longicornis TaxID=44386 RepID=A0A9J6FS00_HAELO|nr:hypothetical protein HPB48_018177 [Haemaphysalis longicornis]